MNKIDTSLRKVRNTMRHLYENGKLHTVVVTDPALFPGWADIEFMPVFADNRAKFKAMWGKPDFYFRGSHYFHVWVKEFKGEMFLVLTALDHGTVIEIVRPGYNDIDGKKGVIASFAKALLKEIQLLEEATKKI